MNTLLQYAFPITQIVPTPSASTGFLRQICAVGKPKDGGVAPGVLHMCTTGAQVAAYFGTQATSEVSQLFAAGMTRVYVLPVNDLNLSQELDGHESDFFTIALTSDFTDADVVPSQAQATATVTAFASLLTGTPDTVTIGAVTLTAQAAAATPGLSVFQAANSNDATAASLAAQINSHPILNQLVIASALASVVTVKALAAGTGGNDIALTYSDNGASIGMTLAGVTGGKLSGGDGLDDGVFSGVIALASSDDTFLASQAAIENRVAFHSTVTTKAKNLFYALGKLLSNVSAWRNQQYVTLPFADDVNTVGQANNLFDTRVSFSITDDTFGTRLAFLVAGGQAIVAPYIKKNLMIDLQSEGLRYISGNQPDYTLTEAALLEDELQKVINEKYIARKMIRAGVVEITLVEDNFVATGDINIATPGALWRVFAEMRETL